MLKLLPNAIQRAFQRFTSPDYRDLAYQATFDARQACLARPLDRDEVESVLSGDLRTRNAKGQIERGLKVVRRVKLLYRKHMNLSRTGSPIDVPLGKTL